jgi:hypothetical protein
MSDLKPFLAKLLQDMMCTNILFNFPLEANRNEMAGNFSFPIATK